VVTGIAAVAKQDVGWIVVGTAGLTSLYGISMLNRSCIVLHLRLLGAHPPREHEDRMSNPASIGAAVSCASRQRWAPHLQVVVSEEHYPIRDAALV